MCNSLSKRLFWALFCATVLIGCFISGPGKSPSSSSTAPTTPASLTEDDLWLQTWKEWSAESQIILSRARKNQKLFSQLLKTKAIFSDSFFLWWKYSGHPTLPRQGPLAFGKLQDNVMEELLKEEAHSVTPPTLFSQCLKAANNQLYQALLSCHNLMKSTAGVVRYGARRFELSPEQGQAYLELENRLAELRGPHSNIADKMGPWYHMFVIGLAAHACGGFCSRMAIFVEFEPPFSLLYRWHRDVEKRFLDILFHRMFNAWDHARLKAYDHILTPKFKFTDEGLCLAGRFESCCRLRGGQTLVYRGTPHCKCPSGKALYRPDKEFCSEPSTNPHRR